VAEIFIFWAHFDTVLKVVTGHNSNSGTFGNQRHWNRFIKHAENSVIRRLFGNIFRGV